jgi:hypothetical protein
MGILDIFKKKSNEKNKDLSNLKVTDLKKGFMFDFDMSTWTVEDEYLYDWGNEYFTSEYKVSNGQESFFMTVEEDDEIEIAIMKKIKIRSIDEDLPEYIRKNEQPPKKLEYMATSLLLDEERPGYFKAVDDDDEAWEEFIAWDYYDTKEDYVLTIERWDENSFEAAFGKTISEYDITNILPNPDYYEEED